MRTFTFALICSLPVFAFSAPSTYIVTDSEDSNGPTFAWDDTEGTGTVVTFSDPDTAVSSIPIPFPFTFFGTVYTSVYAATDGYLQFGNVSTSEFANTAIPTAGKPVNLIAVFWDGLLIPTDGDVRYAVFGTAPARRLVVTWRNVTRYGATSRRFTFQAALYENGAIRLQYLHMSNGSGTTTDYSTGRSATVGIEDASGAAGFQYLYGDDSSATPVGGMTYSGLAVGFLPSGKTAPWPTGPAVSAFSDTFDGTATGWTPGTPTGGINWAIDGTPSSMTGGAAFSGSNSLNFNDGTDYAATGVIPVGTVTSPSIDVSGLMQPMLRFQCNYSTETTGAADDKRWVEVSEDGFSTLLVQAQLATYATSSTSAAKGTGICFAKGVWHEHIIPLSASGAIAVRFRFEALDTSANTYPGWFIDDVGVEGAVIPPAAVQGSLERGHDGDGANGDNSINDTLCGSSVAHAAPSGWMMLLAAALLLAQAFRRRAC